MRQWKLLAVSAVLALAAAIGLTALGPWAERFTPERLAEIRPGMTRAEVEGILGPPGDYASGPVVLGVGYLGWPGHGWYWDDYYPECVWTGDTAEIGVVFDETGAAVNAGYVPGRRSFQTPLENLTWRGQRQWRRWFPKK